MPLNIISNFAAQVAQRNLAMSDRGAAGSVAKISSGQRVIAAKDDAAALAIGSRLRAEVAAQQQASVNAGQAVSMLQIADGAMSQINDTLVRMKSLAVQAGSDQLGSTERGLIDLEFQQLSREIQRISEDTEFNGQSLINGGALSKLVQASDAGTNGISSISFDSSVRDESVFQYSYNATGEVLTITKTAVDGTTVNKATDIVTGQQTSNNVSLTLGSSANADDVFTYSYAQATQQFTVTNQRTGESATVDITDSFNAAFGSSKNELTAGQTLDVDFSSLGVTLTLNDGFNRNNALSDTLATNATAPDTDVTLANNSYSHATGVTSTAINNVLTSAGSAYDASTGVLTIAGTTANGTFTLTGIAGIDFGSGAGSSHAVADATGVTITISDANGTAIGTVTSDFTTTAGDGSADLLVDLGGLVRNVQTNSSGTDETVNIDLTDEIDAVAGKDKNLSFDQTVSVAVSQFGIDLTLDKGFDRTNNIVTTTGTVTEETSASLASASFAANAGFLNADTYDALLALGYDSTTGVGYDANTGILSLKVEDVGTEVRLNGLAGVRYNSGVAGENSANYAGTTGKTTDISVTTAAGTQVSLGVLTGDYSDSADGTGLVKIQLGAGVFYNSVNENALTNSFTFKIGTGNETFDEISLNINSVSQQALGINGLDVTTAANADKASVQISKAITTLNAARANIGAFQNRLDIATSNLAISTENTEAARSALLDLNVATEMTRFTSKQILVQAGVSMLSQANSLPQNLLRLLQ